jgi:hypothetical protein
MPGGLCDVEGAGENDRRDDELAGEGKPHHRRDSLLPDVASLVDAQTHEERNEASDPGPGREKVDGVVAAVQDALGAGLHRGVAHKAEARQRRPRCDGGRRQTIAWTEDDDGDERGRQNEMHRPRIAEGGVCEDRAHRSRIEGGAPVVGDRGRFEREPHNRGEERDHAGDERQAPNNGRQRGHEPLRRAKPEIGARAERQHRGQKVSETAEDEPGHARAPSAFRHERVTSSSRP